MGNPKLYVFKHDGQIFRTEAYSRTDAVRAAAIRFLPSGPGHWADYLPPEPGAHQTLFWSFD